MSSSMMFDAFGLPIPMAKSQIMRGTLGAKQAKCATENEGSEILTYPYFNHLVSCDTTPIRCVQNTDTPNKTSVTLPDDPVTSPVRCLECFLPPGWLQYPVIIAIDTEWQQNWIRRKVLSDNGQIEDEETAYNDILSYQYTALTNLVGGCWTLVENILYTKSPLNDDRLTLEDIYGDVFARLGIGRKVGKNTKILNISHWGSAEWASLRNREDLAKGLNVVRSCPVTFTPIDLTLMDAHRHKTEVKADFRDSGLLAPQGKARLEQLADTTLHKKLKLAPGEIKNMATLLATDPVRFARYAIGDTRVALEYYMKTIATFRELFPDVVKNEPPMTLGGAAVEAFFAYLEKHPRLTRDLVFGTYKRHIVDEKGHRTKRRTAEAARRHTNTIAEDSFIGGFNQAFEYGECDVSGSDFIIVDVDFAGAYATSMALLPVLDWKKHPRVIQNDAGFELYALAREGKRGIRGETIPIMFGEVDFEFPEGTPFPCLPVMTDYGPIYPLRGTSICTGPEMALARSMGAEVVPQYVLSFKSLGGEANRYELAFAPFLRDLITARALEKAKSPGSLREMLLKETGNSFYGKLCQGLEERTVYNFSGKKAHVPMSSITNGHYAAMITGVVRAALIAFSMEVAKHPGCRVLSATTDGAMVVVPRTFDIEVDDAGRVKPPKDVLRVLGPIYEGLLQHYPIRCLEQGRYNLGIDEVGAWLEIKHVGDRAVTAKTRGYRLTYRGVDQHFAKAGTLFRDSKSWEQAVLSEAIEAPTKDHIATMREIMSGVYVDQVNVPMQRKANLDWDYKRIPLLDGTNRTRPPETVDEVYMLRAKSSNIRRTGDRATVERVAELASGLREHGSTQQKIYRVIHQAVAHNLGGWRPDGLSDKALAEKLGITCDAFRSYKRRKVYTQALMPTPEVEAAIQDVAQRLGLRIWPRMREVIVRQLSTLDKAYSHQ